MGGSVPYNNHETRCTLAMKFATVTELVLWLRKAIGWSTTNNVIFLMFEGVVSQSLHVVIATVTEKPPLLSSQYR